jgi:hypothetical protein
MKIHSNLFIFPPFQQVLKFVNIKNSYSRNAALFKGKAVFVEMDPFDYFLQVNHGFDYRNGFNHKSLAFNLINNRGVLRGCQEPLDYENMTLFLEGWLALFNCFRTVKSVLYKKGRHGEFEIEELTYPLIQLKSINLDG